jgi:hypothetical protein
VQTRPTVPNEQPPRPDAAAGAAPGRRRRWLPALSVLVAIVVVVLGGFVTAAALSEPAGPAVGVAGVVRVRPPSGWELARRGVVEGAPFARLTRGTGNLDVVAVTPYEGTAQSLASEYADRVLSGQLSQLSVSRTLDDVLVASGATGVRFAYVGVGGDSGVPIEGEVTALVSTSGTGAVFDAWAPEGLLTYSLGDLETMIDRAEIV